MKNQRNCYKPLDRKSGFLWGPRLASNLTYQTKFKGKLDFSNQIKKYWRKKIEFSYNFKNWKLDPKLGCEFFMKNNFLMHKDYKKYRIFFGTRFSGKEFGKIDVKYLLEKGVKSQLWI